MTFNTFDVHIYQHVHFQNDLSSLAYSKKPRNWKPNKVLTNDCKVVLSLHIKTKMVTEKILYKEKWMSYRKCGNGNPLMLVHGFAEDSRVWNELIKDLQNHYSIYLPDLPGSGNSEYIENSGFDEYIEFLLQILKKESLSQKTVMIGHSMGGYITLGFAKKYAAYLSGIGLFHSTSFADSEERKNIRRKAINFVKEKGTKLFFKNTITQLFTEEFIVKNSGVVQNQIDASKQISANAVIQYYLAMINRPDNRDLLKSLDFPVLFIMGRHDKAVAIEQNLTECYLPTESHVYVLENTAHTGMIEEKEKSVAALIDFLQSVYTG